jgi:hypothetical protein
VAGFLCFLLGLYISWLVLADFDFTTPTLLENADGQATGQVISVVPTKMSVGPQRVYELKYIFSPAEDTASSYTHVAYSLDAEAMGKEVTVQYVKGQPSVSLPQGMERNPGGYWLFGVLIIPFIGLVLLLGSVLARWKKWQLFERAPIAPARVLDARQTLFIKGRRHYAITFEFEDERQRKVEVSMGSIFPRHPHAEQEAEYLIYPPGKPQQAELVSNLPDYIIRALANTDPRLKEYFGDGGTRD